MVLCLPWMARASGARPNILFIYTDDQRYDALSVVQREHGERGRFPFQPEKAKALQATMAAWRKELNAPMPAVNSDHKNSKGSHF